jgi:hypothetical protein
VNGFAKSRILQKPDVEFKDLGGLGSKLGPGAIAKFLKLLDGFLKRTIDARDLSVHFLGFNPTMWNLLLRLSETEHRPYDDAGGNRDAVNDVHGCAVDGPMGRSLRPIVSPARGVPFVPPLC